MLTAIRLTPSRRVLVGVGELSGQEEPAGLQMSCFTLTDGSGVWGARSWPPIVYYVG